MEVREPSLRPLPDWQPAAFSPLCPFGPESSLSVQPHWGNGAVFVIESPERQGAIMSDIFRPYEKLVEIKILGKKFQVPEKNSVLRCFQYLSPETVPYGRFCWNQECQYCRIVCQLPDDDEPREMLSCKFIVMPGMEILELSQELKWCLRAKLPAEAAATR